MSLTPAQLTRAASAYRALLRAQRITFKGDTEALSHAHRASRILFNRFVPSAANTNDRSSAFASTSKSWLPVPDTDSHHQQPGLSAQQVDEHIDSAFEIAQYLRKNVVQGVKNEQGNYTLRITEETERGDNDTIKQPKPTEARVMRGPTAENAGVRRRRRKPAASAATEGSQSSSQPAEVVQGAPGCCSSAA